MIFPVLSSAFLYLFSFANADQTAGKAVWSVAYLNEITAMPGVPKALQSFYGAVECGPAMQPPRMMSILFLTLKAERHTMPL